MTNRAFKTGESRNQASLLPARIEDYVGPDNPVRAIESFVCVLDLAKLGFRHADVGQITLVGWVKLFAKPIAVVRDVYRFAQPSYVLMVEEPARRRLEP